MGYAKSGTEKGRSKKMLAAFSSVLLSVGLTVAFLPQGSLADEGTKGAPKESVEWEDDFNKALEQNHDKLIMVDVYTPWCIFCKKLENVTYPDPIVSKTLKNRFICVKLNAEDNANGTAFCKRFGSGAYPTIYFFDHDQFRDQPKAKIIGYLPPDNFQTVLEEVGKSTEFKQYRHKDFVKQDVTSHSEVKAGAAPAATAQPVVPPIQKKADDF